MKIDGPFLVIGGLAIVLVIAAVIIILRATKGSPEKRERKRRLAVSQHGRLGDAFITEASDSTIYYEYSVQGVQYTASQDVSALVDRLPGSPERLIGVANLKYAQNNPANSILISEEWSGLRVPKQAAAG